MVDFSGLRIARGECGPCRDGDFGGRGAALAGSSISSVGPRLLAGDEVGCTFSLVSAVAEISGVKTGF